MKGSNEAFWWTLFSAGGMVAALLIPVLIFSTALAPGFGWEAFTDALAYGEPDADGRPSRRERFLLTLTNQIRCDPHAWPDWDTSLAPGTALNPVGGLPDLFQSARFHADDMATNVFFSHTSSDGTDAGARIGRFFSGPAGENIYFHGGSDDPYTAMTGWMNSEGHRINILRDGWTWLGAAVIVTSTVYIARREALLAREKTAEKRVP